jgi:UDP-N-acetylglucosamine acyltransferase
MSKIHPTAIVHAGAELGTDVEVGPYCVIGGQVRIGDGTRLMSHVVVDGRTTLGRKCQVFPFASLGTQTQDLKFAGGKTFVEIGDETTIREYVTVNSGTNEGEVTRVGSHCLLMACCHVAHFCQVGNHVIMANGSGLAGHVVVEDGVRVGGITGVHQFVRIGRMCIVGGCSKITQDCPPFMIVDGNPATVHGPNSVGLKRAGMSEDVQRHIKEAYRILWRQNLGLADATARIRAEIQMGPELEHLVGFVERSERGIVR